MKIKILTGIYVFVFVVIILAADFKGTRHLLDFTGEIPFGDKIGHFVLMGTLSLLVNSVLRAKTVKVWKINYLVGSLIVLSIVSIEEFSQMFIAGRSFDSADLAADYAGIFMFGKAARRFYRKRAVQV